MSIYGTKPYTGSRFGFAGLGYYFYVGTDFHRVELYISRGSKQENEFIFDQLVIRKAEIENKFGGELNWRRLDEKIACRIAFKMSGGYNDPESTWPVLQDEMIDAMIRLEAALGPELEKIRSNMRTAGFAAQV